MTKFKTPKPLNTLLNKLSEQQGSDTIQLSPKTQLTLIYPKKRETEAKNFINENINQLLEIVNEMPLTNSTVHIIINDTGNVLEYNTNPYGGKSFKTESYLEQKHHKIFLSLDDVSGVQHEWSHVFDYDTFEKHKQSEKFKIIHNKIKTLTNKFIKHPDKRNIVNLYTTRTQLKYETSDDEIFVRLLNQQYCRTHEPNIFADQIKPVIVDIMMNYLYNNDSEYKQTVDEFINEIPKINEWYNTKRVDVLNYTYVDDDDVDEFVQILTQITNETKQLNEKHI